MKKLVPPPSKREKIDPRAMQKSYLDRIEDDVVEMGVVAFDVDGGRLNIDDGYLTLPANITDVPSKELGEYLNAFTQQKMYLRTILGRAELLTEEARRMYYSAGDSTYRRLSVQKLSETAKDRILNSDQAVRPSYEGYVDMKRKVSLVEASISNIEDAIFMLSREVTRRVGDFNNEMTAGNVHNRR